MCWSILRWMSPTRSSIRGSATDEGSGHCASATARGRRWFEEHPHGSAACSATCPQSQRDRGWGRLAGNRVDGDRRFTDQSVRSDQDQSATFAGASFHRALDGDGSVWAGYFLTGALGGPDVAA